MSTKHIRTAADLVRYKAFLKITCTACGNTNTVGGFDILKASEFNNLQTLQTKLKCSLCGAKNPKLDTVMPPPKNRR
jgi:ribosomal protein S27E